jgi:hypothetical protein
MKKPLFALMLPALAVTSYVSNASAKNCYCQVSTSCDAGYTKVEDYGVIATYPWYMSGKKSRCSAACNDTVTADLCNIRGSADTYCSQLGVGTHVLQAFSTVGESITNYDSCDPDMPVGTLTCSLSCICPTGGTYDPSSGYCYMNANGTTWWANPLSCEMQGYWETFAACTCGGSGGGGYCGDGICAYDEIGWCYEDCAGGSGGGGCGGPSMVACE